MAIRLGETVRVRCECGIEYSARAPAVPNMALPCTSCWRSASLIDRILGPQGVWLFDPASEGCNARVFELKAREGATIYAAFCSCGWWGLRQTEEEQAKVEARDHRAEYRQAVREGRAW